MIDHSEFKSIDSILTEITENDDRQSESSVIFQQDRAPLHYAQPIQLYLDVTFPGRRIRRRGATEWLSGSLIYPS